MRILILLCFLSASYFSYGQWNYKGLGYLETFHLTLDHDTIYASTRDGIYKKYVNSTDTNWTPVGLQGFRVTATMFLDNQRMIGIFESDTNTHNNFVFISQDRGASNTFFYPNSVQMSHFFGGRFLERAGSDTVYLLSHGVRTYDGGQNWHTLDVAGNVIIKDPLHSNEVYVGSTTMISSVVIQHSADYGDNWAYLPITGFYPGDNHIFNMALRGDDMYATGQGIINRRNRWANQWTQLYQPDHNSEWLMHYRALDISPVNDNYVYVSGGLGGATHISSTQFRLLISSDKGNTWDSLKHNPGTHNYYNVNGMTVQRHQQNDIIWLGGTGIYTYTKSVPVSVKKAEVLVQDMALYPNPVTDKLHLNLGSHRAGRVEVAITNALGQQVYSNHYDSDHIEIDAAAWVPGYYQCTVAIDGGRKTLRFAKLQ